MEKPINWSLGPSPRSRSLRSLGKDARKPGRVKSSKPALQCSSHWTRWQDTLVLIQNTTHNSGWKGSANAQCHIEAIYQGDRECFINNEPSKAQPSHCFVTSLEDRVCVYMHLLGTAALDLRLGFVVVLRCSSGLYNSPASDLKVLGFLAMPSFPSESIRVYHLPQTL